MTTAAHHGSHLTAARASGARVARPGLVTFAGLTVRTTTDRSEPGVTAAMGDTAQGAVPRPPA